MDYFEYNYECVGGSVNDTAEGGYGLNCDGVIYLDIYVKECDNASVEPGYTPSYGGGTYIPSDPYDGGGGGGSGGSTGYEEPTPIKVGVVSPPLVVVPAIWQLNELVENKPLALFGNDIPCELVQQWIALAKHKVDQDLQAKVYNIVQQSSTTSNTLLGIPTSSNYVGKVLDIDNAYSSIVNMDFFSVKITKLPVINGQRLTPEQLLYKVRTNINTFVNTAYSGFSPLVYGNIDDRVLWNSTNPRGAIVSINIGGPDNGSVVVSKVTPNSWIFSTIKDPVNGFHPVSGNREFGYTSNSDGSYTFYVKGVDRITDPFTTFSNYITSAPALGNDGIAFEMADLLWESFQKGIRDYVNQPGADGQATIVPGTQYRPDWVKVKDVRDGILPLSTLSNDCN
ncbi:hypothetical protein ABID22_003688 [Pontibacter aydingkolensis]|uniref:Uncharacterized protein n=1 Tax=Pontibacter aydingkolensis TaxID=1911536 RepID=A0ABS7CYS1_9BACT|nr:hypothetical protein [Pontibacter aydingkolensis]MBW7468986.1 hypothetical protein [Pontibacter aydingkolensis]